MTEAIPRKSDRQILSREETELLLGTKQKRRSWLNAEFLKIARSRPENRNYIEAHEFNLTMHPDVRMVAAVDIAEAMRNFVRGNEIVYGIPVAGDRVAAVVADRLWLPISVARKGNDIPGSWNNVLSFRTHSYTTGGEDVTISLGFVEPGACVILIDDVIASGQTIEDAIEALGERGVEVVAVGAMFVKDFEGGASSIQQRYGIPVVAPVHVEGVSPEGKFSLAQFNGNADAYP